MSNFNLDTTPEQVLRAVITDLQMRNIKNRHCVGAIRDVDALLQSVNNPAAAKAMAEMEAEGYTIEKVEQHIRAVETVTTLLEHLLLETGVNDVKADFRNVIIPPAPPKD